MLKTSALLIVAMLLLPSLAMGADMYDKRIKIIEPKEGQSFHPGDVLPVTLQLDAALAGKRIFIDTTMKGSTLPSPIIKCNEKMRSSDGSYKAECILLPNISGSILLFVFASNTPPPWHSFCAGSIDICDEIARKEGMTRSAPVTVKIQ